MSKELLHPPLPLGVISYWKSIYELEELRDKLQGLINEKRLAITNNTSYVDQISFHLDVSNIRKHLKQINQTLERVKNRYNALNRGQRA